MRSIIFPPVFHFFFALVVFYCFFFLSLPSLLNFHQVCKCSWFSKKTRAKRDKYSFYFWKNFKRNIIAIKTKVTRVAQEESQASHVGQHSSPDKQKYNNTKREIQQFNSTLFSYSILKDCKCKNVLFLVLKNNFQLIFFSSMIFYYIYS